ncbi:retrovirus-related pol polyprotein from transposon TNT 1-94 [Tanacetum coccineum]
MIDSQMDDMIRNRNALKQEIDSLKPTLCKQVKEKELLLQTFIDKLSNPKFEQLDIIQTLVEIEFPKELPKCSVDKKYSNIQKKELSLDNDRILDHIICQDMMYIVMHADSVPANVLPTDNKYIVHICVNSLASRNDYCEIQQGMKSSSNVSRSQTLDTTKNNKISRTTSNTMKNKVEVQPRSVKSSSNKKNHVIKPICDVNVKHTTLNANSEVICVKCNKCMFDANHDVCFLEFANDVNVRYKSKYTKKSKNKNIWKPTRKVFTDIGYRWKPTRRTFTIVGNTCPLTRITSTKVVPLKETTSKSIITQNPEVKVVQIVLWYLDFVFSKHMIGNRSQLINFVNKFLGTIRFRNDQIAKIMGYGDHQMGKVAFRKHTRYIRDLEGVDLLKGSRGSNFYTLSLEDMMLSSPICLLSKASKTKSWLWHRRLSHLNFDYLTTLAKRGLVRGLPRLKFQTDHLCSACALGKSKKHSHKPKAEDSIQEKLYVLHMDLCRPMRIQNEVPEFIITFLKMIQLHLNATVRNIRTDNGTEFVNQTLRAYYKDKPDLSYLHVFAALCYPTNDSEDLGKVKPKEDIEIFVGYAPTKKAFQIYNKRIYVITETIHVEFDELTAMPFEQFSSGPEPQLLCNLCPFLCFEYSNLVLQLFDVC